MAITRQAPALLLNSTAVKPVLLRNPKRTSSTKTERNFEENWLAKYGNYSATLVTDYVKNCTVLLDDSGQASIIDKLDASRVAASTAPYASDSEKLQKALMEDFL